MIVEVKVSEDKMKASVILKKVKEDDKITPKEILDFLKAEGVVYGIDLNTVNLICKTPQFDIPILVATGKEPVNGMDGRIDVLIHEKESEKNGKRVDFREFQSHKRIIVRKGQRIAVLHPPTEGEDGINVFGEKIPASSGKEFEMKLGENAELKENEIYAKVDGILVIDIDNHYIDVGEVFEINGDVDYSIGNVDFPGIVKISGDVKPGFVVRAKSDIEISGIIEAATVISLEGNIIVNGIKGREKGIVKCAKDLQVRFAENANIEAKNVYFKDLLNNCRVKAADNIISQEGKGVIVGGEYIAGVTIEAEEIGSEIATPTHLEVGVPPNLLEERKLLNTQIALDKQNAEKLLQIVKQYKTFKEKGIKIPDDKKALFAKATTTLLTIREQLEKNNQRLKEIEELINRIKVESRIIARKFIYPGVEVSIQGVKYYINKKLQKVVLKLVDNNVVVGGYKSDKS